MTGAKFVPGILSCGVETLLSQTIADANRNFMDQMEEEKMFLDSYSKLSLNSANSVKAAEEKDADVTEADAYTQFYSGLTQASGPLTTIGLRTGRELGLSAMGGQKLSQIEEESTKITNYQKALHEGDSDILAGQVPNPGAAERVSDDEIFALRHKDVSEYDQEDVHTLSKLKNAMANAKEEENPVDISRLGKAHDDIDEKLNKAKGDIDKKRESYHGETDRYTNYLHSFTQASVNMAQGFGGLKTASEKEAKANLDAVRSIVDFSAQNQKSAADMTLQGSQNSAQLVAELARAKNEIAQANRI